eukprot:10203270-Ditylum_brightwellii.AAC.1
MCEAWKGNSRPIEKLLLDKFQTPNVDTVPILDNVLCKHKCPASIRDKIVGSVISKTVSLGTWNKKSGNQQQQIWLMWDLSIRQILSSSTRKLQSKTSNHSIKKLFTNLDRH